MFSPFGIYCHVPFCRARCAYCDFNTYTGLDHLKAAYVGALVDDIDRTGASLGDRVGSASTLFLGGGTPSLLAPGQVGQVVNACRAAFDLPGEAEVTIEANPFGLEAEYLEAIRAVGVNRISLGVQAFDDQMLPRMGRLHSAEVAIEAVARARRAGFDNLSFDLIYGYCGQTFDQWRASVERAIDLGPDHLSLYALTVEEGTPLADQVARGRELLPDPDLAADMYLLAEERLAAAGYGHYEISNWARPGFECRHNLIYWRNQPYLGFGAGAHSSLDGRRFWAVRLPGDYIVRVKEERPVIEGDETIGRATAMAETMILGLRLAEGAGYAAFGARFGTDLRVEYAAVLADLAEVGLLRLDTDAARLTDRGRLLGNQVFVRFLPS